MLNPRKLGIEIYSIQKFPDFSHLLLEGEAPLILLQKRIIRLKVGRNHLIFRNSVVKCLCRQRSQNIHQDLAIMSRVYCHKLLAAPEKAL